MVDTSMGQLPSFLSALVGQRVTRIARILYQYRGAIDPGNGPLEIEAAGRVLLLDAKAQGDCLRVRERAWEDPFVEPLSNENRAYVEEHGKWHKVDCSLHDGYSDFISQPLTDIRALENEWRDIAGVRLSVAARSFWFVVEGDECHLYWAHPIGFTEAR
jgi:hypothetical protein